MPLLGIRIVPTLQYVPPVEVTLLAVVVLLTVMLAGAFAGLLLDVKPEVPP